MSKLFNDVEPGDLIKAIWWNQVVHTINSFDDRISALEQSAISVGKPVINPLPPGPWHVGDVLTITGQNLGPVQFTVVTIGTGTVNQFAPGSSDTSLIFTIPTLFVANGGTALLLTVQTPQGSATTSIIVFPAQATVPNGLLVLSPPTQSPTGTLGTGTFTFTFTFTANINIQETFNVAAAVDVGWAAIYVDGAGNPISHSQLTITPTSTATPVSVTVPIKVTIPASPAPVGQLSLVITSQRNASLTKGAGPFPLTIGGQGPVTNPTIQPSLAFPVGSPNYDGTNVLVVAGTTVLVPFNCIIVNPGTYNVKVIQPTSNPGNLWTVALLAPTPQPPTGNAGTIIVNSANTNVTALAASVGSLAGAAPSSFTFRIELASNTTIATELPVPIKL